MSKASVDTIYAEALKLAENQPANPGSISRIAKATSDDAARWAFSQWALRKRAQLKFAKAREMLFDQEGLEMSTHESLGSYHAALFPKNEMVYDLTAGIGADLIALAKRGPTIGFEIEPSRAQMARQNLAVHGLEAEVIVSNSVAPGWLVPGQNDVAPGCLVPGRNDVDPGSLIPEQISENIFLFADPARRSAGRRFTDPSEFQPNPVEIIQKFETCKLGVIKLSPMLPDEFLDSLTPRLEFVSFGGECREALAIFGSQVLPGRFAVQVETGSILEADDLYLPSSDEPRTFLYEADPAAIRAHALGNLCEEFGIVALSDTNGYLTGDQQISSPWLTGFRVIEHGRFDVKVLKKRLAELGSGTPVLKQRGTKLDLQKFQKQMILKGSQSYEVAFYAIGNSVRQVILERLR